VRKARQGAVIKPEQPTKDVKKPALLSQGGLDAEFHCNAKKLLAEECPNQKRKGNPIER